jgi:hypothetical protein
MKPKTKLQVLFMLLALGLLSCLTVFGINQYRMLNGPCVPIEYPGGERALDNKIFEINASVDTVIDFYDRELDVLYLWDENVESEGRWYFENLSEDQVVYECNSVGSNNNNMSVAIGCVYVIDQGNSVKIETLYFQSGDVLLCP